jgi:starvation-inducible outer membrane lipoprotein
VKQVIAVLFLSAAALSACTSVPGAITRPDAIPPATDSSLG